MFAHGHLAAGGPPGGSPVIGSPMFLHGDPPLTQQVPSRGTAREASAELGSCCCVKGLTRSTMMTTDTSATVVSRVAYTAFGDPVTPDGQGGWRVGFPPGSGGVGEPLGTRYQYDGGWGYESGLISLFGEDETLPPVTLQHVGWRWYQPSIGRFVQRDPVGLAGGLNVYAYVRGNPLLRVDPRGLFDVVVDTIVDRHRQLIYEHIYHYPSNWWEKLWWNGPRYIKTNTYRLVAEKAGCVGSNTYDDAIDAAGGHGGALVKFKNGIADAVEQATKDVRDGFVEEAVGP